MLATLTDTPFDDPDWVFETKWDGNRMVATIEKGRVTLYSRNGKIVSDNYMPVAKALEKISHRRPAGSSKLVRQTGTPEGVSPSGQIGGLQGQKMMQHRKPHLRVKIPHSRRKQF